MLSLNDNQLTELPKEIGNLVNLIELDLRGNQLTELPKEITKKLLI
jgi:Leucine-rich repeat (LRR) protein